MTVNESLMAIRASRWRKDRQDALNSWIKLAFGIVLVLVFIFGVGRLSSYIPGAQRMAEVIEDHDLRATAIFYTDFDTSADSSEYVRHSLTYPPRNQ
jgi:hypothetical protein